MYQILRSVLRKQPAPPQELIVPSMGPKSITHTVYKASNHSSATTTPIVKTEIMDSDSSPISTPAPTAPTKALKAGKRDFDKQKSKVFELIDKFRELGIQEDISLPQVLITIHIAITSWHTYFIVRF